MNSLLFIYGTLKEGFPNHALNHGVRLPGVYRTKRAYPLYVVRLPHEDRAPWLVDLPGQGHRVVGQVFQVEAAELSAMDEFEEVGRPGGYVRASVELEPVGAGGVELRAFSYLKPPEQLARCLSAEGPFPEYTHALAAGYWLTAG
jgi:gamma-glutamylaminecyclotransferase